MNTSAPMNFSRESSFYTGNATYSNVSSNAALNSYNYNAFNNDIKIDFVIDGSVRYTVFEVADWFLIKSDMTHKKLQKLCYYAQAWYYALYNKRFMNTDFQAWVHGPVSPALWERFKGFGIDTIRFCGKNEDTILDEDKEFLEDIWETYGKMSGNALEALSHRELPWLTARIGYNEGERCTVVIQPQIMIDYYKSIYSGD